MPKLLLAIPLALGLVACGGHQGTGSQTQQQIQALVDQHRASVTTVHSPTACADERARYGDAMAPMIDRMKQMGDMGSMCGAMRDELARHMQSPCDGDEASAAETQRHCDMMTQLVGSGSGGMMGGGMMGR